MEFKVTHYVFTEEIEKCRFNLTINDAIEYYRDLEVGNRYKAIGIQFGPTSAIDILIKHSGFLDTISDDYKKVESSINNPDVLSSVKILTQEFISQNNN